MTMSPDDVQAEVDLRLALADSKRLEREIADVDTNLHKLQAKREKLVALREDQIARAYDLMRDKERRADLTT